MELKDLEVELKDLEYFVAVGQELHFGRAAARLHIVPAAVTQRIQRLERELGVDLFERTSRRVALSSAGRTLLPAEAEILNSAAHFARAAEATRERAPGRVHLGFAPNLSPYVAQFVARVTQAHPEAEIVGRSMWGREAVGAVQEGDLTAAIVRGPVTGSDLETVPFGTSTDGFVALPEDDPLVKRPTVELSALGGRAVLVPDREAAPLVHDATLRFFADHAVAPVWRRHAVQEYGQEMTLVAAGVGAALVHTHLADERYPGVAIRRLEPAGPTYDLVVVLRGTDRSPVARTVRELRPGEGMIVHSG